MFTATGCGFHDPIARVASLGLEPDGSTVRVIVPACAGDRVADVRMYSGPAMSSGTEDLWAIESTATAETAHEFVVGEAPPGFRVTQPYSGTLPDEEITVVAFGPRLVPGASSITGTPTFALVVFRTGDLRPGEVFYGNGHRGARDEFEVYACPSK